MLFRSVSQFGAGGQYAHYGPYAVTTLSPIVATVLMKGREPCHPSCRAFSLTSAHFFVSSRCVARCPMSVGISHFARNAVLVFTSSTQQMVAVVQLLKIRVFSMFPFHLQTLQPTVLMARRTRCTRQISAHEMRPRRIWKDANLNPMHLDGGNI